MCRTLVTPEIAQSPCGAWASRRGSASSAKGLDEPDTRDQTDEKERNWINDTPLVMAAKGGHCDAVRQVQLLATDKISNRHDIELALLSRQSKTVMVKFTTGSSDAPPDLLWTLAEEQLRGVTQVLGDSEEIASIFMIVPQKAIPRKDAAPHKPITKAFGQGTGDLGLPRWEETGCLNQLLPYDVCVVPNPRLRRGQLECHHPIAHCCFGRSDTHRRSRHTRAFWAQQLPKAAREEAATRHQRIDVFSDHLHVRRRVTV